jgi:hypothetical protein
LSSKFGRMPSNYFVFSFKNKSGIWFRPIRLLDGASSNTARGVSWGFTWIVFC